MEADVLAIAQEYITTGDLAGAQAKVEALGVPNPKQFVLLIAEGTLNGTGDSAAKAAMVELVQALDLQSPVVSAYANDNGLASADGPAAAQAAPVEPEVVVIAQSVETGTPEVESTTETAALPTPTTESATATPEPSPTPTVDTAPRARVTSPLNVRSGPGTAYDLVGGLQPGEEVVITGKNAAADWWEVTLAGGIPGWVYGQLVEASGDINAVAVVTDVPAPPQPTAAPPVEAAQPVADAAPTPAAEAATPEAPPANAGPHFVLVKKRLWDVAENGGRLVGTSVVCGEKRQLVVEVLDANGAPVNGVSIKAQLGAQETAVSGDKGPGRAEFVLGGGQELKVVRDADGRDATSDVAYGLTTKPWEIPYEYLIAGRFCTDDSTCKTFVDAPGCYGHYSWTVTFQRNY